MRILLVEDDQKLAKVLKRYLAINSFVVDVIHDGLKAEERAKSTKYDLILLDLSLPSKDGMKVCKALREYGITTPILILTGRSDTEDKIKGLNLGADDYLGKPFDPEELIARIKAILRRPKKKLDSVLRVGDLKLNPNSTIVERAGNEIELMPKEYALLEYLMRNKDNTLTKNELLHHVWGVYSNTAGNRLEVYIRYLRAKIDEGYDTRLIKTVRGKGYKITAKGSK